MRTRVLAILTTVSLLALGLIVPLLNAASHERTQDLLQSRIAALNRFALLASDGLPANDNGDGFSRDRGALQMEARRFHDLYGEAVLVVNADRQPVASFGRLDPRDRTVAGLLDQADRNSASDTLPPLRPWSLRRHFLARPIGVPDRVLGAVVLEVDAAAAIRDVRRRWGMVIGGVLLVEVALLGFATYLTAWVIRPVRQLDEGAVALARTGKLPPLPGGGPAELRHLARSFAQMAAVLTSTIDMQRRMVADSSHQLRNPLAALRLRIDALAAELRVAHGAAFASVNADLDRLEDVLGELLRLAEAESRANFATARHSVGSVVRAEHPAGRVALGRVVADEFERWEPVAEHAEVRLRSSAIDGVMVHCNPSDLHQIVAALIDNAVKYSGAGATVEVTAHRVGPAESGRVVLTVADDGPGLRSDEIPLAGQRFWRSATHQSTSGTGLGLAIVDQLARANEATMAVRANIPTGLAVDIDLAPAPEEGHD